MADVHLQNWRDERGSELEKAQRLIQDRNNSLKEVSEVTGIPLPTLKAYRGNPDKLTTAAWERVNKLSQMEDVFHIQNRYSGEEMKNGLQFIDSLLSDLIESNEGDKKLAIVQIRKIILSDPLAVAKILETL